MAPKKAQKQKMSLGDFLENKDYGSWADEMESLPTAPAPRAPDDPPSNRYGRGGDRDFSSRPERSAAAPREDLPLPTAPPYIAYVGNLSFDLTEELLGQFFEPEIPKSVKVIKDREDKPKGFGYVEFETLDGLKKALTKSGTQLNSRTVRVSVAEPPKERGSGFSSFADDSTNWRRDGPLPPADSRGPRGSRFDDRPPRESVEPSVAETTSDWRSSQPTRTSLPPAELSRRSGSNFRDGPPRTELNWERKATMAELAATERPSNFRRGSGLSASGGDRESAPLSAAETDDIWRRGPSRPAMQAEEQPPKRVGFGGRGSEGSGSGGLPDAGDWRSQMKSSSVRQGSVDDKSPTGSQPQTPQGGRKRLDLLPRSTGGSTVPSPLSSPRMTSAPGPKSNPFGTAKPVDVSNREREISEKLEKEHEGRLKEKPLFGSSRGDPMSRQESTSGGPRPSRNQTTPRSRSPAEEEKKERPANKFDAKAAQVRAQTSFAAAAGGGKKEEPATGEVTEKLAEVTV